jgi:hypothetical protein
MRHSRDNGEEWVREGSADEREWVIRSDRSDEEHQQLPDEDGGRLLTHETKSTWIAFASVLSNASVSRVAVSNSHFSLCFRRPFFMRKIAFSCENPLCHNSFSGLHLSSCQFTCQRTPKD